MFALDEHMSAKIRASYSEPVSNIWMQRRAEMLYK
jgi:hypothetical protein